MEALQTGEPVSLLGKWLPSVNASGAKTVALAKKVAKSLKLRPAEYRKALTALRERIHILENNLRVRDYSFDYAKLPSKAMYKYRARLSSGTMKRGIRSSWATWKKARRRCIRTA